MDTEGILDFLRIDMSSDTPLRTQLEARIDALLRKLESGTHLPPERLIAERLKISRVTVRNALQKFYEQGKITRHGRRGTMVAPMAEQDKLKDYNLMALGASWVSNSPYSLKFLLYENLPPQKKFWSEVVDSFNAGNPDFHVEIVWMESSSDAARIREIIEEKEIDLLLDSHLFGLEQEQYFHRFSDEFRKQLSSAEYLFDLLPACPEYCLPVNIVVPMLFWNCELAEKCGFPMKSAVISGRFADLAARSMKKLPKDVFACGRVWDYFSYTATPEAMDSPEQLQRILEEIAEAGKKAADNADRLFMTSQKDLLEHVELFLRGKLLCLPAQMTFLQIFDEPSFSYGKQPFPKQSGEKLAADYIAVAITRNCLNTAAAEQFLAYLLSPKVQKKCAEIKKSIPVRYEDCSHMLVGEYGYGSEQVKGFLESLQFGLPQKNNLQRLFLRFCIHFVREELHKLLQGTLSSEEAARIIMSKWQRFRKSEERNSIS